MFDNFFCILDDMMTSREIEHRSWHEIEEHVYHLLSNKNPSLANYIQHIDLSDYQSAINHAYLQALTIAKQKVMSAIYFEYDMNNQWQSNFFLCPKYTPKALVDALPDAEDWACYFDEVVEGPDLQVFGDLYSRAYQEHDARAYLVARTITILDTVYQTNKPDNIAICMAFHDQDPMIRLQDIVPTKDKIFNPNHHVQEDKPVIEFTPLEIYIRHNYFHFIEKNPTGRANQEDILRALSVHQDKIFLNYCPFCGALRRTPRAKQCPVCFKREETNE